jgi:hypothetical protein
VTGHAAIRPVLQVAGISFHSLVCITASSLTLPLKSIPIKSFRAFWPSRNIYQNSGTLLRQENACHRKASSRPPTVPSARFARPCDDDNLKKIQSTYQRSYSYLTSLVPASPAIISALKLRLYKPILEYYRDHIYPPPRRHAEMGSREQAGRRARTERGARN